MIERLNTTRIFGQCSIYLHTRLIGCIPRIYNNDNDTISARSYLSVIELKMVCICGKLEVDE
jgi:hypothetical protein